MASKIRSLPTRTAGPELPSSLQFQVNHRSQRHPVDALDWVIAPGQIPDLALHNHARDEKWCRQVGERICEERSWNRRFVTRPANWNFAGPADLAGQAEKFLRAGRLVALVVSRRMLEEDWPSLENLVSSLCELGLARGRFVTILKENVSLPPLLRLQEWIDFRDGRGFEEGLQELSNFLWENSAPSCGELPLMPGTRPGNPSEAGWKTRPLSVRAVKSKERIISNLFPVLEFPKEIFCCETKFRAESEILEACGSPGPLPFLLKGSKMFACTPLTENSVFGPALRPDCEPTRENFSRWLSDPERAPWAVEFLNRFLRYHGWKRGLRFDEGQGVFYFTRSRPKNLWWEIGGKIVQREVTAPHMKWNPIEGGAAAEFQCGWRHEAIRAGFVQVAGSLFLRMEPAWFLTELDGKTPATVQRVETFPANSELNSSVLRTLRFWSGVFSKGHRELRIDTSTNPIRVRLIPACISSPSALPWDQMDFDRLAIADIDGLQRIPDLGPVES